MSLNHLKAMGIDVWLPRTGELEDGWEADSVDVVEYDTPETLPPSRLPPQPQWQAVFLPSVPANQQGDYLIVCADALIEEGARESVNPFSGQIATLFDGMIKATQWDVNQCVLLHDVSQFNLACEAVKPKMIVLLGLQAVRALHPQAKDVASLRAEQSVHLPQYNGIPYVITFHPNLAVQDAQFKRPIWEDLKRAMAACS